MKLRYEIALGVVLGYVGINVVNIVGGYLVVLALRAVIRG